MVEAMTMIDSQHSHNTQNDQDCDRLIVPSKSLGFGEYFGPENWKSAISRHCAFQYPTLPPGNYPDRNARLLVIGSVQAEWPCPVCSSPSRHGVKLKKRFHRTDPVRTRTSNPAA
jgi:hypothetical protein